MCVILQAYCIQGVDKVRVATFFLKRLPTYVQCFFVIFTVGNTCRFCNTELLKSKHLLLEGNWQN